MTITAFTVLTLAAAVLILGLVGEWVLVRTNTRVGEQLAAVGDTSRRGSGVREDLLNDVLMRTKFGQKLSVKLAGAGVSLTPSRYVLLVFAVMLLMVGIGLFTVGRISTAVLVLTVPLLASKFLEQRRAKRTEKFIAQLPEIARVLSNAASAGLSVPRGLGLAAREMNEPATTELTTVVNQIQLGRSVDFALGQLSERLPSRELNVLVRTLVIQARSGGALVKALQDIARSLEERRQLRREARTAFAGSVFGGYLVIGMGVGTVILANLMFPGVIDDLATSGPGLIALSVALTLYVAGFVLMRIVTKVNL